MSHPCPVSFALLGGRAGEGAGFSRRNPVVSTYIKAKTEALWIAHRQGFGLRNIPVDSAKIYPPSSAQAHLGKNLTYSPFPG